MNTEPKISKIVSTTFISAFTVLMALAIRDTFTKTVEVALPNDVQEKLLFNYIYTLLVIMATVTMIYFWT